MAHRVVIAMCILGKLRDQRGDAMGPIYDLLHEKCGQKRELRKLIARLLMEEKNIARASKVYREIDHTFLSGHYPRSWADIIMALTGLPESAVDGLYEAQHDWNRQREEQKQCENFRPHIYVIYDPKHKSTLPVFVKAMLHQSAHYVELPEDVADWSHEELGHWMTAFVLEDQAKRARMQYSGIYGDVMGYQCVYECGSVRYFDRWGTEKEYIEHSKASARIRLKSGADLSSVWNFRIEG